MRRYVREANPPELPGESRESSRQPGLAGSKAAQLTAPAHQHSVGSRHQPREAVERVQHALALTQGAEPFAAN
jgi:hypothetical protein